MPVAGTEAVAVAPGLPAETRPWKPVFPPATVGLYVTKLGRPAASFVLMIQTGATPAAAIPAVTPEPMVVLPPSTGAAPVMMSRS